MRITAFGFISILLIVLPHTGLALGLGTERLLSGPGEPLGMEIEVLQWQGHELDNLLVEIGSRDDFEAFGLDYPDHLDQLSFRLLPPRDERLFVLLIGQVPLSEPFLNVLISLRWPEGSLLRQYRLVFDPELPPVSAEAGEAAPWQAAVMEGPGSETQVSVTDGQLVAQSQQAQALENLLMDQQALIAEQEGELAGLMQGLENSRAQTEALVEALQNSHRQYQADLENAQRSHSTGLWLMGFSAVLGLLLSLSLAGNLSLWRQLRQQKAWRRPLLPTAPTPLEEAVSRSRDPLP